MSETIIVSSPAPRYPLTLAERETHLNMTGDNREYWEVFSDDPVMIAKLDKIATGIKHGYGKKYTLRANQVSFRTGAKRVVSDEQRAATAKRFAEAREAKKSSQ